MGFYVRGLHEVHGNQRYFGLTAGQPLVERDPFTSAVLTELGGKVNFKDIVEGENVYEETAKSRRWSSQSRRWPRSAHRP